MHILFSVHFNSPQGGLHENVFSTVAYSLDKGYKTTVLCKEGPFAERLRRKGSQVIITDFESIDNTVEKVLFEKVSNFDVIHTHPGPSRKVAMILADRLDLPIVMTFHGMWLDSIIRYSDKLSAIITVSEGVKDFLKNKVNKNSHKFVVIPNGVDRKTFKPPKSLKLKKNKLNISLVTRLDKDKEFIIKLFYEALSFTNENYKSEVNWTIVGTGTELEKIKKEVLTITQAKHKVNFVGWQTGKKLKTYYQKSDIVIAPGRSALEAMACGKPVIAIGSKKYNGLVTKNNWLEGVYSNFGGFGNKFDDYVRGTIEKELEILIENQQIRKDLGKLGLLITEQFYDERVINGKIVALYDIVKKEREL